MTHEFLAGMINSPPTKEKLQGARPEEVNQYLQDLETAAKLVNEHTDPVDMEDRLEALSFRAHMRADPWRAITLLTAQIGALGDVMDTILERLDVLARPCDECGAITAVTPTAQTAMLQTAYGDHCSDQCADKAFLRTHGETDSDDA